MGEIAIGDLKPGMIIHRQPSVWDDTDKSLPTRTEINEIPTACVVVRARSELCVLLLDDQARREKAVDSAVIQILVDKVAANRFIYHATREEAMRAATDAAAADAEQDLRRIQAWRQVIAVHDTPKQNSDKRVG